MALGHEKMSSWSAKPWRKTELDRMAAMLSRSGGRGDQVRESAEVSAARGAEVDPDSDSDLDETQPESGPRD